MGPPGSSVRLRGGGAADRSPYEIHPGSDDVLMSIAFYDERGVRWTVATRPALRPDDPGNTTLVFTSERGERRVCEGCLPEGGTWEDVDDRVWCALLRHAEVLPPGADGS